MRVGATKIDRQLRELMLILFHRVSPNALRGSTRNAATLFWYATDKREDKDFAQIVLHRPKSLSAN